MTITSETVRVAVTPVISLKGRGKAQREMAYMQIAPLSFIENISRVESIANLRAALGASPTEAETKTAQTEWSIGRVASRLPAGEFPKGVTDDDAKLDFARKIVLHFAAPAQEGKQARKLRAGQLGRRTMVQHKVCRAADEAWSQVKAELGLGQAQTQAERNKAKRATNGNPVRGDGKGKSRTPTHGELVKPVLKTADEVCAFVESMASTLLAFANKNGKLMPLDYGSAIQSFKSAINKAANDRQLRKAEAESRK